MCQSKVFQRLRDAGDLLGFIFWFGADRNLLQVVDEQDHGITECDVLLDEILQLWNARIGTGCLQEPESIGVRLDALVRDRDELLAVEHVAQTTP